MFTFIHIDTCHRSSIGQRPMDMKHVMIRIIYTALDNTRNITLYQNWLRTVI
jgi:hypothetical protein